LNTNDAFGNNKKSDEYVHGMDWLSGELEEFELSNYGSSDFLVQ